MPWKRLTSIGRKPIALLVLAALLAALLLRPWQREEQPFVTEQVTFGTNVVAGTTNDQPVTVPATLYTPRDTSGLLAAVVIVPSSSGVQEEREIHYAKALVAAGIAALVVDSYGARGIENSLYDQSLLDQWEIENDAIAALGLLSKDARIDPRRIAIMGVSKGGTAAMDSALTIRRRWMGVTSLRFAAHVAITPDCTWMTRQAETTGAPMLFLLAGLDDQTPAQACLDQAKRMTEAGNTGIETEVYDNAHHAWEELGRKPVYDPEVENYAQCRVWILNDGSMMAADTGEPLPEDDWWTWAEQNCMTLGATCCGGTQEQKTAATERIITFLRAHGF